MSEFEAWPHLFEAGDGPVLLALHGTGGNERDILPLARAIDPMAAVLAPRGQVIEGGALRWFRRLSEGVFDVDDVVTRAGDLAEFIGWAVGHYGLEGRRIVAVGFSNGANVGLATAALHPQVLPEAIAFSGMYPFAGRPLTTSLEGSRMLLANGTADPMAPSASVARLAAELSAQGAEVTRHERAGGHGIDSGDVDAAREWLAVLPAR
ncbi:phospholipase/carboxylesterase [Salinibacterium sp. CAN_S4]|uniref:alpha/beta hydrolase n=1 Tax=Salinibacterium sp. CAN_S4 TaxID=2787727 RepID=UPI0018EF897D